MADTALAGKLRVAAGSRAWMSDPARAALLGTLPAGATVMDGVEGSDVAVAFTPDAAAVHSLLSAHARDYGGR